MDLRPATVHAQLALLATGRGSGLAARWRCSRDRFRDRCGRCRRNRRNRRDRGGSRDGGLRRRRRRCCSCRCAARQARNGRRRGAGLRPGRRGDRGRLERRCINRLFVSGTRWSGIHQRGRGPQLDPEVDDRAEGKHAEHAHRNQKRQARIRFPEFGLEHALRSGALRACRRALRFGRRARALATWSGLRLACGRRIRSQAELQWRAPGSRGGRRRRGPQVFAEDFQRRGDVRKLVAGRDLPAIVKNRCLGVEHRGACVGGGIRAFGAPLRVFLGLFGLLEGLEKEAHVTGGIRPTDPSQARSGPDSACAKIPLPAISPGTRGSHRLRLDRGSR